MTFRQIIHALRGEREEGKMDGSGSGSGSGRIEEPLNIPMFVRILNVNGDPVSAFTFNYFARSL